jgi:nucleoside phosphorylase
MVSKSRIPQDAGLFLGISHIHFHLGKVPVPAAQSPLFIKQSMWLLVGLIGLIAAMTQESEALLRIIKTWKRVSIGSMPGINFKIGGQDCLLVTSGMGMQRAAESASMMLENALICQLISFGIAGAVEPELVIGDVIAVDAVCQWMDGTTTPLLPLTPWVDKELRQLPGF